MVFGSCSRSNSGRLITETGAVLLPGLLANRGIPPQESDAVEGGWESTSALTAVIRKNTKGENFKQLPGSCKDKLLLML